MRVPEVPLHVRTVILMPCTVPLVMHALAWFALSEQHNTQDWP